MQLAPKHRPTRAYMARIRRELPRKFPGVETYFMPADVVTQVLNFGVSSMIDVQIESKDPRAGVRDRARARAQDPQGAGHRGRAHRPGDQPPGAAARRRPPAGAAAELGYRDVAASVLTSLSSSSLTSPNFWVNPKTGVNYTVAVQTPIARMASVDDLLGTPIAPPGGLTQAEHDRQCPQPHAGAAAGGRQRAQHHAGHRAVPGRHRATLAHARPRVGQSLHRAAGRRRAGVGVRAATSAAPPATCRTSSTR